MILTGSTIKVETSSVVGILIFSLVSTLIPFLNHVSSIGLDFVTAKQVTDAKFPSTILSGK